jgi:hypothetical protein
VVDLAPTAERLPDATACETTILGIPLPRLIIAAEADALALILAWLRTAAREA